MKNRDCKHEVDPILVDFRASFTIEIALLWKTRPGVHTRVLVGYDSYENELEKVFNQEITVTRDKEEHLISRPGEYIKTNLSYHVMNKVNRNHRKEERQSRNRTDHSRVSWNISFSKHDS